MDQPLCSVVTLKMECKESICGQQIKFTVLQQQNAHSFGLSEAIRFVCAKIAALVNNNKKKRAITIDQATERRWMVPVAHHP